MRKRNLISSVLAVLAVGVGAMALTANGSQEDCCAPPEERPDTIVTYETGGGFAPSFTRIEIGTDGVATVEQGNDPEDPRVHEVRLSDAEITAVREALIDNPIDELGDPENDDACYDCFSYSLTYQGETYDWDSGSPASESRADVIEAIIDLPLDLRQPRGWS